MAENPAPLAKLAWEKMGQFTMPDLAPDDPDGRATLYMAGYLAGYTEGYTQSVAEDGRRRKRLSESGKIWQQVRP